MKKIILFPILLSFFLPVIAQRHEIFSSRIATLQVIGGNRWTQLPIIQLYGNEAIHISFDDLTHQYHRYTYTLQHCEADWTTSDELFTSEYLDGFAEGNVIDDIQESINTTVLYNHYKLQIPNEQCRLKMSGNYRLTVYDENNDNEKMLEACFMVVEPRMVVKMNVSSNTDIDINHKHQQVDMQVSFQTVNVVQPLNQIKTVVMQNRRWDNARINAKPQFISAKGLQWSHCRDYIFTAGNEYRKYEILDVDHPTMGIDKIKWDGTNYQVYPFISEPRYNYIYDEDANGAFFIRNSDNEENNRLCDYVWVNYELKCPSRVKGEVYINGAWTYDRFEPPYQMNYNEEKQCYQASIFQKQGYYNYQYLLITPSGDISTMPTEGDFYQTENSYQALVYFRGQGDRSDLLVGYGKTE